MTFKKRDASSRAEVTPQNFIVSFYLFVFKSSREEKTDQLRNSRQKCLRDVVTAEMCT